MPTARILLEWDAPDHQGVGIDAARLLALLPGDHFTRVAICYGECVSTLPNVTSAEWGCELPDGHDGLHMHRRDSDGAMLIWVWDDTGQIHGFITCRTDDAG